MRRAVVSRDTTETSVEVVLDLDGEGKRDITSGCGFLDHMLTLLAVHGRMDIEVRASGDIEVDYHHLVEDVGICLGDALGRALGDKEGVTRYGWAMVPMDEALACVAVDLSGRAFLRFAAAMPAQKVGDFDTELVEEFMRALANHAGLTLHVNVPYGSNAHHVIEAIFKALALALRQAASKDERASGVPSSKGVL